MDTPSALVEATRRAVATFAGRHGLLPRGATVVVAVSGGPDSVCLLDCLQAVAGPLDLRLHVACLDHMLRHDGSAADDAAYVQGLAARYGLGVTCGQRDVRALMRAQRLSAQTAARLARYAFLDEVAGSLAVQGGPPPLIATGHTASDQAETVLLHLIRGSGLAGLAGLRPRRGQVIHPLLDVDRATVEAYCAATGLQPRQDPSNASRAYTRNRVRHDVIPVLAALNPRAAEALARTASTLALDLAHLENQAEDLLPSLVTERGDGQGVRLEISAAGWQASPVGLRPHLVRAALTRLYGNATGFEHGHTSRLVALLDSGPGKHRLYAQFPRRLCLEVGDRGASLMLGAPVPAAPRATHHLPVPGEVVLPHGRLVAYLQAPDGGEQGDHARTKHRVVLDAAITGRHLLVRSRRAGDRLQPAGMGGHHKKVQDLLVDAHVPRAARAEVPLVVRPGDDEGQGEEIVWVVGHAIGERFRVTERTEAVLCLSWAAARPD